MSQLFGKEPCGLTPASLKHLKRQRDALSEEMLFAHGPFWVDSNVTRDAHCLGNLELGGGTHIEGLIDFAYFLKEPISGRVKSALYKREPFDRRDWGYSFLFRGRWPVAGGRWPAGGRGPGGQWGCRLWLSQHKWPCLLPLLLT